MEDMSGKFIKLHVIRTNTTLILNGGHLNAVASTLLVDGNGYAYNAVNTFDFSNPKHVIDDNSIIVQFVRDGDDVMAMVNKKEIKFKVNLTLKKEIADYLMNQTKQNQK